MDADDAGDAVISSTLYGIAWGDPDGPDLGRCLKNCVRSPSIT